MSWLASDSWRNPEGINFQIVEKHPLPLNKCQLDSASHILPLLQHLGEYGRMPQFHKTPNFPTYLYPCSSEITRVWFPSVFHSLKLCPYTFVGFPTTTCLLPGYGAPPQNPPQSCTGLTVLSGSLISLFLIPPKKPCAGQSLLHSVAPTGSLGFLGRHGWLQRHLGRSGVKL